MVYPKYLNQGTLKALGLFDDTKYLFSRLGMWRFVNKSPIVYDNLAVEFLSSVSYDLEHESQDFLLTFRLLDNEYSMTCKQFNKLIGTPLDGAMHTDSHFVKRDFWTTITGAQYETAQRAKASLIWNPNLRYVQAILSRCAFPKGETTRIVKEVEMEFLYYMLVPDVDFRPNVGHYILHNLVAANNKGVYILGGHFATLLAEHYNLPLGDHLIPHQPQFLDAHALWNMKAIEPAKPNWLDTHNVDNKEWVLVYAEKTVTKIYLPDPANTTVIGMHDENLQPVVGSPAETEDEDDAEEDDEEYDPSKYANEMRDTLRALDERTRRNDERQESMERNINNMGRNVTDMRSMMDQMYGWHISQHHFMPPPPPEE